MIQFLFRVLSIGVLGAAIVLVVLDATQSIAADELILMPLAAVWADWSPRTFAGFEQWTIRTGGETAWLRAVRPVLGLPGCAVLAGLAVLLGMAGHRPEAPEASGVSGGRHPAP